MYFFTIFADVLWVVPGFSQLLINVYDMDIFGGSFQEVCLISTSFCSSKLRE